MIPKENAFAPPDALVQVEVHWKTEASSKKYVMRCDDADQRVAIWMQYLSNEVHKMLDLQEYISYPAWSHFTIFEEKIDLQDIALVEVHYEGKTLTFPKYNQKSRIL